MNPQLLFITDNAYFTLVVKSIHRIYKYEAIKILMPFNKCHYTE